MSTGTPPKDWQQASLRFLMQLHEIKSSHHKKKDLYQSVCQLLHQTLPIHCVRIIEFREPSSAREVFHSKQAPQTATPPSVDGAWIQQIIRENKIWTEDNENDHQVCFPYEDPYYKAVCILCFPLPFQSMAGYESLFEVIWTGLKDISATVAGRLIGEHLQGRLNAILSTLDEAVVFVDEDGGPGWINKAAASLLQLLEGENKAVDIASAMHQLQSEARNVDEIRSRGLEYFQTPENTIKNWKWIYGDPVYRALHVSSTPSLAHSAKGRLWFFADITPLYTASASLQELNKELDEKNAAKSDFLSNMSHEIRTPMNGIIGITGLLADTQLNPEQKEYVNIISSSGEMLLTIINDILDLSKIESGKMELERIPLKIHAIIEDTFDVISVQASFKGLDLLYEIHPDVPAEIYGDPVRLKQILINFVANAVKFTESGTILVRVNSTQTHEDYCTIEFEIKDSGIGIDPENFKKLFDRFSQATVATTREYGGTGLGLSIAHKLIQLMGGEVRVESQPNKGSSFIFTVPVSAGKNNYIPGTAFNYSQFENKQAMVLDSNRTNLLVMARTLKSWGLKTTGFAHYKNALAALHTYPYDVIVMDMKLIDDKSGWEIALQIHDQYPNIPILLLGFQTQMGKEIGIESGAIQAFITKPFKPEKLYRALSKIFSPLTNGQPKG